jgi:hypothetical protein
MCCRCCLSESLAGAGCNTSCCSTSGKRASQADDLVLAVAPAGRSHKTGEHSCILMTLSRPTAHAAHSETGRAVSHRLQLTAQLAKRTGDSKQAHAKIKPAVHRQGGHTPC